MRFDAKQFHEAAIVEAHWDREQASERHGSLRRIVIVDRAGQDDPRTTGGTGSGQGVVDHLVEAFEAYGRPSVK